MDPRPSLLLVLSAVFYFAGALALLFAPEELLTLAGAPPSTLDTALLQALGSALFGFAMLNWMSRHSRIGGIFGRPILVANLAHTASAALLLGHIAIRASLSAPLTVALTLYSALAVAFGLKLSARPTAADPKPAQSREK
jgi:hypothetical protein